MFRERIKLAKVVAALGLLLSFVSYSYERPLQAWGPCSKARLAFILTNTQKADRLLELFATNLLDGDYLLVGGTPWQVPWVLQKAGEARRRVKPGVNVFSWVGYVAITELEASVPNLPREIDWVVYDYEGGPGFSPEFTRDQATSVSFFDRGHKMANASGFKFMVTPPYGQLRTANWDWGEVAKHMDGIDIQFQAFLQDLNLLENEVPKVVAEIAAKSPTTLTFIQLSVVPTRGTLEDNITAIQRFENNRQIAAFLMFYSPLQVELLAEFFAKFRRCQGVDPTLRTPLTEGG